jgi:hypothetical protein
MPSKKQKAIKEIFEKMQKTKKHEKTRIQARRKAQKKGKSIATQKNPKKSTRKPVRERGKVTKKRSSIR